MHGGILLSAFTSTSSTRIMPPRAVRSDKKNVAGHGKKPASP
jgi:hypothetical protein